MSIANCFKNKTYSSQLENLTNNNQINLKAAELLKEWYSNLVNQMKTIIPDIETNTETIDSLISNIMNNIETETVDEQVSDNLNTIEDNSWTEEDNNDTCVPF